MNAKSDETLDTLVLEARANLEKAKKITWVIAFAVVVLLALLMSFLIHPLLRSNGFAIWTRAGVDLFIAAIAACLALLIKKRFYRIQFEPQEKVIQGAESRLAAQHKNK